MNLAEMNPVQFLLIFGQILLLFWLDPVNKNRVERVKYRPISAPSEARYIPMHHMGNSILLHLPRKDQ